MTELGNRVKLVWCYLRYGKPNIRYKRVSSGGMEFLIKTTEFPGGPILEEVVKA